MSLIFRCLRSKTFLKARKLTILGHKASEKGMNSLQRLEYHNDRRTKICRKWLWNYNINSELHEHLCPDYQRSLYFISARDFNISLKYGKEEIIKAPQFPESVTDGDVKWSKAVGDEVLAGEVICEIETDKTAIAIAAPGSGVIKERIVGDGATVTAGQPLFKIELGPVTRKEAVKKERPVEKGREEERAKGGKPPAAGPGPPAKERAAGPAESMPAAADKGIKKVKIPRIRQKIAQRLKAAQNEAAMLTTFNEIDMSNLIEIRKKLQKAFEKKYKVKLGFMSPFIKASAYALMDQPIVNSVIVGNEIWYRETVDISVAVASPKGLVVPVIHEVLRKSYGEIEKDLADMAKKAREGTVAVEEMEGGTFSITNGGVFGSLLSTPIINPPQSAILGMHATKPRPVAINNKVEIRPMMYVALTYDHRLIDGREAVRFLIKIKDAIEHPEVMLLNL